MGLRETINNNSAVVVVGTVVLLVLALGYIVLSLGGGGGATNPGNAQRWYLNTKTDTLFADDATKTPPFQTDDGGEAVLAMVFTCKDTCGKADLTGKKPSELSDSDIFVGYLVRTSKKGMEQLKKMQAQNPDGSAMMMMEMMTMFQEYRRVDSEKWGDQKTIQQINKALQGKCTGRRFPKACYPGTK